MKMMVVLLASVSVAAALAVLVNREPSEGSASASLPPVASSAPAVAGPSEEIGGQVREAIDVADYTYLRLQTTSGAELWAAVSKAPVTVGSSVTIANAARMTDFHSASLKRTFDVIYFGNLGGASPHAAQALPPGHPQIAGHTEPGHGAMTAGKPAPVAVPLASGPNARTIAALFSERASLAGQKVRVQGQVVKVTPVQGVSYIRLRDGSSADAASAELLVSSRDAARVGEVATFEGAVGVDIDVGIGTTYPVMLQEAKRAP
jgi:hypothetical protein